MFKNNWKEKYEKVIERVEFDKNMWSEMADEAYNNGECEKALRYYAKVNSLTDILVYMKKLEKE